MKDEAKLDELMKRALDIELVPEEKLNENILMRFQEGVYMKNSGSYRRRRTLPGLALAAVLILAMGITCFAAARLLSAKQAAEELGEFTVAKAFEGKDALPINQTMAKGGYSVTLLGVTGGEKLSALGHEELNVQNSGTYAVVAIAKEDGTPMPSPEDDAYLKQAFFVSPLIKGLEPWRYNIATMNGSYGELLEDGILYRMIQCDNVEIFADKGVYLCFSDTSFYDNEAFVYDEATGNITVNENYGGVNLLFELPLDPAKGDSRKAEDYVKGMEQKINGTDEVQGDGELGEIEQKARDASESIMEWSDKIQELINQGTLKEYLNEKELLKGPENAVTEDGEYYYYEFALPSGMGGRYSFLKSECINGMGFYLQSEANESGTESFYLILVEGKADGKAQGSVYRLK